MLFRNVHWLHGDEATECLQCSMGDGVRHRVQLTGHTVNMEDLTGAEMAKEVLGLTMFTS